MKKLITLVALTSALLAGTMPAKGTETNVVSVTNDMTLTWNWETQYMFSATSPSDGSISGTTNGWYSLGSPISITANPDAHKVFDSWSNVPAGQESNQTANFILDLPYTNVVANYAPEQHTLTVQSAYGTPNPGNVTVDYNTKSTQTVESVVNGTPGVRYRNTGSTLENN